MIYSHLKKSLQGTPENKWTASYGEREKDTEDFPIVSA